MNPQPDPMQQAQSQLSLQSQQPTPEDMQGAVDKLKQMNDSVMKQRSQAKESDLQAQQQLSDTQAAITRAMAQLQPKSKDPQVNVGRAIQTPAYAGYCLKYIDDQTGNTNRQPTAFADYQVRAAQGKVNTSDKVPEGARVYFAPDKSNGGMGHVGLMNKDGTFTSATDAGIKTFTLPEWQRYSGQKYIGYSK